MQTRYSAILAAILKKWPTSVNFELDLELRPVNTPSKFEVDPTKRPRGKVRTHIYTHRAMGISSTRVVTQLVELTTTLEKLYVLSASSLVTETKHLALFQTAGSLKQ